MSCMTNSGARFLARSMSVVLLLAGAAQAVYAADSEYQAYASKYKFEIYGFAQADYIQDFKGRVDPNWQDALRPSKIDTNGTFGTSGQASISAKQSRFGVKGLMPSGGDTPITFKFEFDLFGTGADEGKTTIRLRHMYGEWGSLLAGQTHTLFMDIDAYPNTIEYWGPPGMAFIRLPTIRWTPFRNDHSHFSVAIERPGNDIDPGNVRLVEGFNNALIQGDETVPDFTTQYYFSGDWGHAQIAGIYRKVGYEYRATTAAPWREGDDDGYGVDLSTAINVFSKDKILLTALYGHGIATYLNDGGMDLAPRVVSPAPNLVVTGEAVPITGIMAYYDHYWNNSWSTSIGYSYTEVDNTNFQDPGAFHKGEYATVNLLAYPAKNLLVGGELQWGKRTNNVTGSGDVTRLQISVKYSFSSIP
jgi:hypothetical protein